MERITAQQALTQLQKLIDEGHGDKAFTVHLPEGYSAFAKELIYHDSCDEVHVIPFVKKRTRCPDCGQYTCVCERNDKAMWN